mmetsp:Transcript_6463/g.8366  ORF Transcript_6463/g.8366 Transcript_6463/m.8366 type:complete len:171 (+) Transcript_6463:274-786(+)
MCNNKEIVLIALKSCGESLYYVSNRLKNDYDVVKVAVLQEGNALCYASKRLQNHIDIIIYAISQNLNALRFVDQKIKNRLKSLIEEKYIAHLAFIAFLLGSLDLDEDHRNFELHKKCPIFSLHSLGSFIGKDVKMLISQYSGVPCSSLWRAVVVSKERLENVNPEERVSK